MYPLTHDDKEYRTKYRWPLSCPGLHRPEHFFPFLRPRVKVFLRLILLIWLA